MWTTRLRLWRFMLCILFCASAMAVVSVRADDVPSESQCRPYIEKALKELESGDTEPVSESVEKNDSSEVSVNDDTKEISSEEDDLDETNVSENNEKDEPSVEVADEPYMSQTAVNDDKDSKEEVNTEASNEVSTEEGEAQTEDLDSKETIEDEDDDTPDVADSEDAKEEALTSNESQGSQEDQQEAGKEAAESQDSEESQEEQDKQEDGNSQEGDSQIDEDTTEGDSKEDASADEKAADQESGEDQEEETDTTSEVEDEERSDASKEADDDSSKQDDTEGEAEKETEEDDKNDSDEANEADADSNESKVKDDESQEDNAVTAEEQNDEGEVEASSQTAEKEEASDENKAEGEAEKQSEEVEASEDGSKESQADSEAAEDKSDEESSESAVEQADEEGDAGETPDTDEESTSEEEGDGTPEEDLLYVGEIPENLRSRDHINQILRLDETASEDEITVERSADIILRDLKRLYENSIKPLETLYKYRDLSNRHFGDPEIFSKPLVLFMGPWSGGKSSIVNYLTGLEFTQWSLRTGAEPSPAYFNILMHGNDPEVLDGTQLAADWTFSGLQKFGQGLEERLRGLRHPSKILEKVNIVEIPGILEVRKQVSRVFPFNDACQWFIDRADIIFLVYDPSKLDVGPETEAILDQLKGRESQTRIVLNKADTVKPEELMRVQSALIWNISPLMSSAQPPVMYTVSLWSMPYEAGAPVRLLQAQERELLRDLRHAIDKRIENKIASARRFAVRVRNHAKMVDCYLTTYYNHKTIFGNRKIISDAIIENPQNYHIYEGLSTLTNISRYDLPDPETYRDFFRLNPLYEFQQLSATCTYFRGCPITRLDVAIAYDLPELVGRYKKMVETATPQGMPKS